MAWNGSDSGKVKDVGQGQERKRKLLSSTPTFTFNYKALIAGLIVVLVGGLIAWLMLGNDEAPTAPKERKTSRIAEVTPSPAPKPKASVPEKPKYDRPQIAGEIRDGYRLLPNGKLHKVTGVHTSNIERLRGPGKGIHHRANQTIIDLLRVQPGEYMLGESSMYYAGFDKDFLSSEDEDIAIKPDDDEETKAVKEALIATRKELRDRQAKGEDLVKVMREAREQLRELHLYREELSQEVKNIAGDIDKEFSEKDIDDLVSAANKMLEERGSMPLQLTAPLLYQLREEKIDRELEKQGIVQ